MWLAPAKPVSYTHLDVYKRQCHGFGMNVLCYDMYKNPEVEKFARYVSLEELLQKADLVSLHLSLIHI